MLDVFKSALKYLPKFLACLFLTVAIVYAVGVLSLVTSPVSPVISVLAPPQIQLLGEPRLSLKVGDIYEDAGAVATYSDSGDSGAEAITDSDSLSVVSSGKVDTTTPGNYLISYSATDQNGNTVVASRVVEVTPQNTGIIYLTFDDGPGPYTAELLDILAKYNVKATFFVTNAGSDDMLRREYEEGHAIGLHTCSHNYAYIYQSVDNFLADLYCAQSRVKNATGHTSYLIRFPGGSSNLVSAHYDGGTRIMSALTREVEARGFTYFDWNVTSGDAGETTNSDTVFSNVISRVFRNGKSVVLQHDIKSFSIAAVERIIEWGLANGFTFAKLDQDSFSAHHGVNN